MTKYDELIRRLRMVYEADELTNHNILLEAADAIEDLIETVNQKWIPIQSRHMTAEESKEYRERTGYELDEDEAVIYTSKLPDDGQDVLVSYTYSGDVGIDTFCDDPDYGCFFETNGEMDGISAWMPLPKPYKEEPHGA